MGAVALEPGAETAVHVRAGVERHEPRTQALERLEVHRLEALARIALTHDQREAAARQVVEQPGAAVQLHPRLNGELAGKRIRRAVGRTVEAATRERSEPHCRRRSAGADRGVPLGGLERIELAERAAQLDREGDDPLVLRLSLGGDRVQKARWGLVAQDEVELPGEVHGIAEAGAEPLSEERRRQVRRVAGQEHAAVPHALGQERAELVDDVTQQAAVAGAEPRRQELPGALLVERLRILPGQQHELPSPVSPPALDVGGRARRVAPLAGRGQIERGHVGGLHIGHEPALLEAQVAGLDSRGAANERVRAVRPDHPAGSHALPAGPEDDLLGRLLQAVDLPTALHEHAGLSCTCLERPFERGLEEQIVGLPARWRRGGRLQRHQLGTVRAEPVVVAEGHEVVGQRPGDPQLLEDPHHLVVEMNRSRHPIDLVEALVGGHRVTGFGQENRDRLADRAETHHRHVHRALHARSLHQTDEVINSEKSLR